MPAPRPSVPPRRRGGSAPARSSSQCTLNSGAIEHGSVNDRLAMASRRCLASVLRTIRSPLYPSSPHRREGATRVVLRKGGLSLFPMSVIDDLLQRTSRTFALAIPLLPEPTRNQVGIAYLLYRIADTFEDAVLWTRERRLEGLGRFVELLDQDPTASEKLASDCLREPPLEHAGYRELLARMPLVLRDFGALPLPARVAFGGTSFAASMA